MFYLLLCLTIIPEGAFGLSMSASGVMILPETVKMMDASSFGSLLLTSFLLLREGLGHTRLGDMIGA